MGSVCASHDGADDDALATWAQRSPVGTGGGLSGGITNMAVILADNRRVEEHRDLLRVEDKLEAIKRQQEWVRRKCLVLPLSLYFPLFPKRHGSTC